TACAVFSVLLLYSLYYTGIGDLSARYYIIQLVSTVLGIFIALVIASMDYHHFTRLWFIYVPAAIALVALTFTSLGLQRSGADDRAWLDLGFITMQPSEFLKLAFILSFSYHLNKDSENINHPLHLLFIIIHGAVPVAIVFLQGDYGTAVIFVMMFVMMLFSAGLSFKYIIASIVITPPALYLLWNYGLQSLHKKRIMVLIEPGTDPMGLEYQQNLGLTALGSGKLFGKGLFSDSFVEVPEIHNDFIFAHIGQAFGFVGAILTIVLLAYICIKVLNDSRKTMDLLGKLICMGTFAMLFTHCFMNIGMVLKVMPVIGIPLPFFSAGGTALLSMYIAIGLVLSCYSHNEKRYRMFYSGE
ncbi:MAG: FtsW/RodA/SpoVE family cell cycle protein, partial [Porcipelethomonas sp.]